MIEGYTANHVLMMVMEKDDTRELSGFLRLTFFTF